MLDPLIIVIHGCYCIEYPVVGMTVAEVRRALSEILEIDPTTVAEIWDERIVDEDARVITAGDRVLSFVKEASVMGPDSFVSQ